VVDVTGRGARTSRGAARRRWFAAAACLLLAGSAAIAQPADKTIVTEAAALGALRANQGITLQWIGFETAKRGTLRADWTGGRLHLSGGQRAAKGPGRLTLHGDVVRIGARHFTFRGRIVITDAPDAGRRCVRDGLFDFRVTGQRRYWRLQQMEACDGLTDYVDIYF
jgi:hypothetical protein